MADTASTVYTPVREQVTTQSNARRQEAVAGIMFMAPAFLILFVFLVLPLLVAFYFSLTDWSGATPLTNSDAFEFVGIENYRELLIEGRRVDDFYNALKNTVYYALGVVPTQTAIALVLAVIVNQRWLKGRGFFRTAYYFPSITSSIVVSMIFLFLFSNTGPVNGLLSSIFPSYQPISWLSNNDGIIHNFLGLFGINQDTVGAWAQTEIFRIELWDWISGPSVSMFAIMLLAIWTTIGTMMVVYLAALQNIPSSVYEAAQVDGATAMQTFRKITLPLLRPTTFFVVTIGLIGTFQVFDQIYVLRNDTTRETTMSVAYLVYDFAFGGSDPRMDRATTTAITLFIIIFLATIIQRRLTGGDQAEA
ncbi:MAG: sugar ABC transporter permease [bacterium]|nr:sugar ABC transporter permease [bacterium]